MRHESNIDARTSSGFAAKSGAECENNLLARLRAGAAAIEILVADIERRLAVPTRPTAWSGQGEASSTVSVYMAGCRGARALGQVLRQDHHLDEAVPIYKIGMATRIRGIDPCGEDLDVTGRIAALGRDQYGAVAIDAWGGTVVKDGFRRWMMPALRWTRKARHPAITLETRTIEVVLPAGVRPAKFDAALRRALLPFALVERFPLHVRCTAYKFGDETLGRDMGGTRGGQRLDRARELYAGLDPVRHGDVLLSAVEDALSSLEARNHKAPVEWRQRRPNATMASLAALPPVRDPLIADPVCRDEMFNAALVEDALFSNALIQGSAEHHADPSTRDRHAHRDTEHVAHGIWIDPPASTIGSRGMSPSQRKAMIARIATQRRKRRQAR